MITIVSPGIYTYGSMVIGGILRDAGYNVVLTKELHADTDTVFVSLHSTLQLIDNNIKKFFEMLTGKMVFVGGPVSAYPHIILGELSNVSCVVVGEGEEIVLDLLERGVSEDVSGIVFRDCNGNIVETKKRPFLTNLTRPLPLIPGDIARQNVRGANVYIETHRGCLGNCDFCQVPGFFGQNIRSRDQEDILAEVKAFKKAGAQKIAVSGGTGSLYGYDKEELSHSLIELLKDISEITGPKNLSVPDMRVDYVSEEVLEAIRRYTMGWVFFGIESGSNRILKQMHKGISIEKAMDAVEYTRSQGVHVAGSFIVGHPSETEKDYELTRDFVEDAMLEDVFVSIIEPIPSTRFANLISDISEEDNPSFKPHTGEYSTLKLSEGEARFFDLMLSAETSKPVPRIVTNQQYDMILGISRSQGEDVRAVTRLIWKYKKLF
ncbi:MAG: Ribosomal protein S12 methylthiotransferase RimO [Candidatus Argoarchaeum ethanivorans]|uniref:Ribosomal protein S12 methylthiotransferase RimO n=1 Tax=Candidatus Argoarchaeum ethanivorans TaxID=2608793 RepID=A0A811T2K7_9EURY|nr:MAG: Ribosomal protein S12 methylthiotransferase RimO [Candidatus Argoarchaeum ethanivorans]